MLCFVLKMWTFMGVFVWARGTLLRFRYDQFMRLGWRGLIPAALIWLAIVMTVIGIDMVFPLNVHSVLIILSLGYSAILLIWALGDDTVKPSQADLIRMRGEEEFTGFEYGYPVPPLPGQHLPPSKRETVRGSAADISVTEELETKNV